MGIIELITVGLALSLDAFAVTVSNSLIYKKEKRILMPIFFGLFQGLMPVLGYFACGVFKDFVEKYSGIVTLLILGFIGGKMIFDSFKKDDDEETKIYPSLTLKVLFIQAIATSIDAFAVGVSFLAINVNIWFSAAIIVITTFLSCLFALFVGNKASSFLEKKAPLIGGIILVIIGLKAMI